MFLGSAPALSLLHRADQGCHLHPALLGVSTDSGMIVRAHGCLPMPSGRPGNEGSAGFAQSGSADQKN